MDADEIEVTLFREILIIPFALEPRRALEHDALASGCVLVEKAAEQFRPPWQLVPDRWLHIKTDAEALAAERWEDLTSAYAEFVYFEPYVQRFLYGDSKREARPPIRIFQRNDIKGLDLVVRNPKRDQRRWLRLEVERLNLYLFSTGTAALVVEVAFNSERARALKRQIDEPSFLDELFLDDALTVVERLRRVFPPYYNRFDTFGRPLPELSAPLFPLALRWLKDPDDGSPLDDEPLLTATAGACFVHQQRCPPIHPRWHELMTGLAVEGYDDSRPVRFGQTGDDRAPFLLLLGIEDARSIERDDWIRLCFADEPASNSPYAKEFMTSFEAEHCYDRFWEPGENKETRYLFCSYGFAMVGSCRRPGEGEFQFFRDILSDHFRRHYFQLGLIANFQKTALLNLSERLSTALDAPDATFQRLAEIIQKDILHFTHRYWFEDISAQLQAQEMFPLWRKHLRTRELYEQLAREVRETTAFLGAQEEAELAREQSRIARAADRLNRLAAFGLVLAVATGFLGMNILPDGWNSETRWGTFLATVAGTAALFGIALGWHRLIEWTARYPAIVIGGFVAILVALAALLA